jgi:hypothetical protein
LIVGFAVKEITHYFVSLLRFDVKEISTPMVTTASIDALLQVCLCSPPPLVSLFCCTPFPAHEGLDELLAGIRVYRCAILQLMISGCTNFGT